MIVVQEYEFSPEVRRLLWKVGLPIVMANSAWIMLKDDFGFR